MLKRRTINEELNRMKGLMSYKNGDYKNPIILEQNEKPPSINKSVEFGPGTYEPEGTYKKWSWSVPKTLDPELAKIKAFLTKNPTGYIVNVNLTAGESQIPNKDNHKNIRVKPGYLSQKRMETLKKYISDVFNSWKKEGVIKDEIKFTVKKPIIGKTNWVGQPFCDPAPAGDPEGYKCSTKFYGEYVKTPEGKKLQQQYTSEQFLRVSINVDKVEETTTDGGGGKKDKNCIAGLEIKVFVPSHQCQNAEFFMFANNHLLQNEAGGYTANLNNNDTHRGIPSNSAGKKSKAMFPPEVMNPAYGYLKNGPYGKDPSGDVKGARADSFIIGESGPNASSKIFDAEKINIWYIGTTSSTHDDIPVVQIKKDGKFIYNDKPSVNEGLLLTLDACGNKVESDKGSSQKPDVSKWVDKLIKQKTQILVSLGGQWDETQKAWVIPKQTTSGGGGTKKELKKVAIDSKSEILERTNQIYNLIESYVDMILGDYRNSARKGSDKVGPKQRWKDSLPERIELYQKMKKLLTDTPTLEKTKVGGNRFQTNFIQSPSQNKKTMYGDIHRRLMKIYEYFDALFYKEDEGKYKSKGKSTGLLSNDLEKIANIKKLQ